MNDSELAQEMEQSQNKLVSDANIKILSVVAPPVLNSRKKSLRSSNLSTPSQISKQLNFWSESV